MKKLLSILVLAVFGLSFTSCIFFHENNTSNNSNNGNNNTTITIPEQYKDFYNYPTGKQNANGTLTLNNQVNSKVLVFTDSVAPANYIGTIPALSSINVKLESGKFFNIVAVQESAYETAISTSTDKNPVYPAQINKLGYYSDIQAYSISVSPENLTGGATWIFNNNTNYWVSIENVDNSGETYAVISPNAKRVTIPVKKDTSYAYKVVYRKELKYNNTIIAVAEKTNMSENDEASFYNLDSFTTDLDGVATADEYADLAPTVQFINNSGKTVRVYNGQVQLSDAGISAHDYTLANGVTAYFTSFTAGSDSTALNIRSVAWQGNPTCTENVTFEAGKVYIVKVQANTGADKETNPVIWTVETKGAEQFYK